MEKIMAGEMNETDLQAFNFGGNSSSANETIDGATDLLGGNATMSPEIMLDLATEMYRSFLYDFWSNDDEQVRNRRITQTMAALSFCGALFVVVRILGQPKERRIVANRIMVAISMLNISTSVVMFLGIWIAPSFTARQAIGTTMTCATGAYFQSIGWGVSGYMSASLALCYLFTICFSWSENRLHKLQPLFFILPFVACLTWVIPSYLSQAANYAGMYCALVVSEPMGCDNVNIKCERGGALVNANPPLYIVTFSLHCVVFLIVIVSMLLIYCSVLKSERASNRYRISGLPADHQYSRQIAYQGIFYILAFLASEVPFWIGMFYYVALPGPEALAKYPKELNMLNTIMTPSQGLLNAIVYLRPRYWPRMKICLQNRLFCCCKRSATKSKQDGVFGSSNTHGASQVTKEEEGGDKGPFTCSAATMSTVSLPVLIESQEGGESGDNSQLSMEGMEEGSPIASLGTLVETKSEAGSDEALEEE